MHASLARLSGKKMPALPANMSPYGKLSIITDNYRELQAIDNRN